MNIQQKSGLAPAVEAGSVEDLVGRLGPRDRLILASIMIRIAEVAERDGQAAALRLVDEIIEIVTEPEYWR